MDALMRYDDAFFAENQRVAAQSAARVMPLVLDWYRPRSVIDVGCGSGEWGAVAQAAGIPTLGVDGYVGSCAIRDFVRADLEHGWDCTGYDLAICLEVAEHLPPSAASALVAGLCKAERVLFSAAHPGQGGVNHVNEQWGTWWAALFAEHGYHGSSAVKWRFWNDRQVREFYRENLLVFSPELPGDVVVDVIHPERLGTW